MLGFGDCCDWCEFSISLGHRRGSLVTICEQMNAHWQHGLDARNPGCYREREAKQGDVKQGRGQNEIRESRTHSCPTQSSADDRSALPGTTASSRIDGNRTKKNTKMVGTSSLLGEHGFLSLGRSPGSWARRQRRPCSLPIPFREQWRSARVPIHSGGTAPDSHRFPCYPRRDLETGKLKRAFRSRESIFRRASFVKARRLHSNAPSPRERSPPAFAKASAGRLHVLLYVRRLSD